jgi:hypothetical protein
MRKTLDKLSARIGHADKIPGQSERPHKLARVEDAGGE